jgi:hypothetical protein
VLGVFDVTDVTNCFHSGGMSTGSFLASDPAVGTTVNLGQQAGAFSRNESANLVTQNDNNQGNNNNQGENDNQGQN